MRRIFAFSVLASLLFFSCILQAQQSPVLQSPAVEQNAADHITVPQGTHVLLSLIHPISTKNAKPGDGVYLKTAFPVAENNEMVIPAGTYVQGEITSVKRAGRIHRAAEVRFRFTTLIFPSGYTVYIPGTVENVPAMQHAHVSDKEGTVHSDPQTGRNIGTVAEPAATGAAIGGLAGSLKGVGIGAGIGGAVGVGTLLLSHGQDVWLQRGTSIEMVFERAVTLDRARAMAAAPQEP